ncbi:MAG: DUF6470 family protein [Christensenellaceae bacterium]|nr:DUF6470 family protein [Christensenellaceae bacterium]
MAMIDLRLTYRLTPARLEYSHTPTQMRVNVDRAPVEIERQPLKMELDNQAFYESLGIKGLATQARERIADARQTIQRIVGDISCTITMKLGPNAMNEGEISQQKMTAPPPEPDLVFIPEPVKIHFSGGTVSFRAPREKVNIDWVPHRMDFRYSPRSVQYYVEKWDTTLAGLR